jgi:hypothetical protein
MTQASERRDVGARRVSVSTLVEVVGNVPGIPVFEAEAIDVSARGMHLRTAYLPHEGDPLVCRFENAGREILVEGVVAWRREHGRGGEFGVQFTALDSKSVESLRELCGDIAVVPASPEAGPIGTRVRLHIEGLGSPMKARVKEGSSARLQVGSSLEFLKLGRKLELEDLERGARREAQIDGVSVIVDPSTRVPQLVVALRFEGADENTPSPHASDVGPRPAGTRRLDLSAAQVTTDAARPPQPADRAEAASEDDDGSADADGDEPEMRGKVAQIAERAGERAKEAGAVLAQVSSNAAKGAFGFLRATAGRFGKGGTEAAPRRTTSQRVPPPKPRLRSQHPGAEAEAEPTLGKLKLSKKQLMVFGAVGVASIAGMAFAMRPSTPAPAAATAAPTEQTVAAQPPTTPAAGAVTANVPLFGPTPLATTEPAPLGAGPGDAVVEAAERADAQALAPNRVPDLAWAEEGEERESSREPKSDRDKSERDSKSEADRSGARPEDVSPWGKGKMHEPTIHRLRLDTPGAALQGASESTGFSVVVPSRKVMEAAGGIAKRDPRIARIRATNTPVGAQISIRFKGEVPAYRVRLRKDYVEFLISAPSEPKENDKDAGAGRPAKPSKPH